MSSVNRHRQRSTRSSRATLEPEGGKKQGTEKQTRRSSLRSSTNVESSDTPLAASNFSKIKTPSQSNTESGLQQNKKGCKTLASSSKDSTNNVSDSEGRQNMSQKVKKVAGNVKSSPHSNLQSTPANILLPRPQQPKITQQTKFHHKDTDLPTQPPFKKKRAESGDSNSSEIQRLSFMSDSGFETESTSSISPPTLPAPTPSPRKEDVLTIDFSGPCCASGPLRPRNWSLCYDNSKNVAHYVTNLSLGRLSSSNIKAVVDQHIVSRVADFEMVAHDKPFSSRITTIDWHPRKQNFFCAASKHGDLGFYRLDSDHDKKLEPLKTFAGNGPGGYISAFKFHHADNERFYTSNLEGKVILGNIERGLDHIEKTLLSTGTWDYWYCAMDVSPVEDFVVASRNNGWTVMCSTSGESIWELRLHSKKVTHAELSPREPHLLCTASLDHSVRIWDLRMMREIKGKPLYQEQLMHEKGINSAYFSLTDGTRLLTTDQHDEIRVYRAPFWTLETKIFHPHRFFQYMTQHKAAWHPLADKIVCGRYPGDSSRPEYGNERTIDMFDAATGKMHCELKDPQFKGLVSLCKFNKFGDKLLSSMGYTINIWSQDLERDDEENVLQVQVKAEHARSVLGSKSPRQKKDAEKFTKVKMTKMSKKL